MYAWGRLGMSSMNSHLFEKKKKSKKILFNVSKFRFTGPYPFKGLVGLMELVVLGGSIVENYKGAIYALSRNPFPAKEVTPCLGHLG